jgi:hypothetical protein
MLPFRGQDAPCVTEGILHQGPAIHITELGMTLSVSKDRRPDQRRGRYVVIIGAETPI